MPVGSQTSLRSVLFKLKQRVKQQLEHFGSLSGVFHQQGLNELLRLWRNRIDESYTSFINLPHISNTFKIAAITADRSEFSKGARPTNIS